VDPLAPAPNEQHSPVDDEPLLLAKVDVQWPAVRAFGGLDVRPKNLVRGGLVAPDPHTAALYNLRAAHSRLSSSPLTPSHDGKENHESHDSHAPGDVCHHGNHPGNVAGVGPDEADNRSDDEQGDHRG
jgi:hypothetical protein